MDYLSNARDVDTCPKGTGGQYQAAIYFTSKDLFQISVSDITVQLGVVNYTVSYFFGYFTAIQFFKK